MKVLISGAAGFIGTHSTARFLRDGATVVGFDNLSRPGSAENLAWLQSHTGTLVFEQVDIVDADAVDRLFRTHRDADVVLHLAAQVAVTTSLVNPRHDFDVNALGTINLLEATRHYCPGAAFLYASTNKVYGGLEAVDVVERNGRYEFRDLAAGVDENVPLDFHSPYGCSKGSADQYVRDYARIYGLRSVVFRQSCIYGTRQFGVEDQGWISWFIIAALLGRPITIYGDGKQIRDVLWVDDLVNVYVHAIDHMDQAAGQIYNVGGGPRHTLSPLELVALLRGTAGERLQPPHERSRPGDQRVFVADIEKANRELGWHPAVGPEEGVQRLIEWVRLERELITAVLNRERPSA